MAVAVRRDDGSISTVVESFRPPFAFARKVLFVRGLGSMAGAAILAVRSSRLERRALGDSRSIRWKETIATMAPVAGAALFSRGLEGAMRGRPRRSHLRKGPGLLSMIGPLVGFRISGLFSPGRSLLQYHAAEHMAVNAAESGLPLSVDSASLRSRIHPRCGTTFAVWAMFVASLFNKTQKPGLTRALVNGALVISIAYEILRLGAEYRDRAWAKMVFGPAWQAQRLTTSPPRREHLEVAVAALSAVIAGTEQAEGAPGIV